MDKYKKIIVGLTIYIISLNIIPSILIFITNNYDYLGIFNILGSLFLLLYVNIRAGSLLKYKYKKNIQKIKYKNNEQKILWLGVIIELLITILCLLYIY